MKRITLIIICALLTPMFSFRGEQQTSCSWNDNTNVYDALFELGEVKPPHYIENPDPEDIRMGKEMVFEGRAVKTDGSKSKYISNIFKCVDCHNQVREDPALFNPNPDTRLEYVSANGLKFYQATTFWGMVNRESWYNDDYYIKYGERVQKANKNIDEATQLCAEICSAGRLLEDWELKAVTSYYWSLQLKLGDLGLAPEDWTKIETMYHEATQHKDLFAFLKSKYMLYSPAHFGEGPTDKEAGYPALTGNASSGEKIYKLSCQTCHRDGGPSDLIFDESKFTFKKLQKDITDDGQLSIYEIIRHGTYSDAGKPEYMPLYTYDRMSNQQVEDLRAYIELQAE